MTGDLPPEWADQSGDSYTNQQLFDKFLEYKSAGIIDEVEASEPLGQHWSVLTADGQALRLQGKNEALAFLAGAGSALAAYEQQPDRPS